LERIKQSQEIQGFPSSPKFIDELKVSSMTSTAGGVGAFTAAGLSQSSSIEIQRLIHSLIKTNFLPD